MNRNSRSHDDVAAGDSTATRFPYFNTRIEQAAILHFSYCPQDDVCVSILPAKAFERPFSSHSTYRASGHPSLQLLPARRRLRFDTSSQGFRAPVLLKFPEKNRGHRPLSSHANGAVTIRYLS